jgi:hypothetical protein
MTTTCNSFPSSWDPFIQGICARRKLPKFNKLSEDCTQEQSRLISKSQKINNDENQSHVDQVKKKKEKEESNPKKSKKLCHRKDASNIKCYT